jgi:hypothetical protein
MENVTMSKGLDAYRLLDVGELSRLLGISPTGEGGPHFPFDALATARRSTQWPSRAASERLSLAP